MYKLIVVKLKILNFRSKIKCIMNRVKGMNYTKFFVDNDIRPDRKDDINVNFQYILKNENVTLSINPNLFINLKFYNMKKLYPEMILPLSLNDNQTHNIFTGNQFDFSLNLTQYLIDGKYEENFLSNLAVAGRLFYILELKDQNFNFKVINFDSYVGQFELPDNIALLKKKNGRKTGYNFTFVIIAVIVISTIVIVFSFFLLCRMKRRNYFNLNSDYSNMDK